MNGTMSITLDMLHKSFGSHKGQITRRVEEASSFSTFVAASPSSLVSGKLVKIAQMLEVSLSVMDDVIMCKEDTQDPNIKIYMDEG